MNGEVELKRGKVPTRRKLGQAILFITQAQVARKMSSMNHFAKNDKRDDKTVEHMKRKARVIIN